MKEMDLIFGLFLDSELLGFSDVEVVVYECLLEENDQDIYLWIIVWLLG